ncbi:arginine N-succinyltransferase [Niveibacterium sp. 24ML]|uniref:arginine N-succinyltransferase n=1 Tax=Niveibacterium sp. 24ML TaxID=2985512 RepID=UPI0022714FC4|nr:arginine N-succinyltransferase [Niveibacterium sp. 24ML]MCX9157698.1 arginine N-succinyltransferase [Niveibacterium sp. 24ML]
MMDVSPGQFVLRPSTPEDLPAIERIAAASTFGINSLPPDRDFLLARIERSQHAFQTQDDASGEESYLFVLEDTAAGRVIGTSGIAASAGFHDRFYSYRNEFAVHASEALGESNRIHTLHLCHDLTGYTLLTSFYIEPDYADTVAPQLLSRARLLFIAEFGARFADRVAAETPGLCDANGNSPFWDEVGRRFFNMDYPQAERLAGGRSKSFIAELMPHSPIYVPLLPETAQWAIGQLHPDGELPFSILLDEGFEADTYIDVFDGGPTVEARVALLRTIRHARRAVVGEAPLASGPWHLVARTVREGFRATLAQIAPGGPLAALDAAARERLGVAVGEAVRIAPLVLDEVASEEASA